MSEKWTVLIIASVAAGLLSLLIWTGFNMQTRRLSVEQEKSVQSACEAAVEAMDKNSEKVIASEKDLQNIRKCFWRAYCKARGYSTYETGSKSAGAQEIAQESFALYIDDGAKYEIPCVLYVDYDGYYIDYTKSVMENGSRKYSMFVTEKQAFVKVYGECHVEYSLSGAVSVKKNGVPGTLSGQYADVYVEAGMPQELSFMAHRDSFMAEHDEVIRQSIEKSVNYYVNSHNDTNNLKDVHYTFAIPNDATGFGRMISHPCTIAFSQGAQSDIWNFRANVYGFAAASIEEETMYDEYVLASSSGTEKYYTWKNKAGNVQKSGTMRELARDGAMPDLSMEGQK